MISQEQYNSAKDVLWDNEVGPSVTTNTELSEMLGEALRSKGVNVNRIGKKKRSRNSFIVFEITVKKVEGMETKFLTEEDAAAWHSAKNRNLNTLMKAPDEAFKPVIVVDSEEMLWWNQAYSLAYRLGADLDFITERILKHAVIKVASKFGV